MKNDRIIGRKYNNLTVKERHSSTPQGIHYKCICDCGNESIVRKSRLHTTKSCGCIRISKQKERLDQYIGQKFNKLTIIGLGKKTKHNQYMFQCKCDCGNIQDIFLHFLVKNKTKHCRQCYLNNRMKFTNEKKLNTSGYVIIYNPTHANARQSYVFEHHLIMSEHLKRPIDTKNGESVHHKNGIKTDNRLENLELWNHRQPTGYRVIDMLNFCYDYILKYENEIDLLKDIK